MNNKLAFIDKRLGIMFDRIISHSSVSTLYLAHFRIFIGLFFLLFYMPSWAWLGNVPQGFFNPNFFNLTYLFDNFFSKISYVVLDILVILLFGLLTLGVYSRACLVGIFFVCLFGYGFTNSLGKIDHDTTVFLFAILTMVFTNCGTVLALIPDRPISKKAESFSLAGLSLIIVVGFFTAGFFKLLYWVDFDLNTSGVLSWFYQGYYMNDRQYLFAKSLFYVPYFLLEIADYCTAIFETFAILFLIAGKRIWRIYLLGLCVFHLLNVLILNILFPLNIIGYGIFIISPVLCLLREKYIVNFKKWKTVLILLTVGLVLLHLGNKIFKQPNIVTPDFYSNEFLFNAYVSILAFTFTILSGVVVMKKRLF